MQEPLSHLINVTIERTYIMKLSIKARHALFGATVALILGFFTVLILSLCSVITPALGGILGVACLTAIMGIATLCQSDVNPRKAKIDGVATILLLLALIVLMIVFVPYLVAA